MADHLDAPGLMSPNMNAAIDITDIYAFQKPGDPSKSILIVNVNPLAPTLAASFDPTSVYDLQIDTDADSVAEIAFRFTFSPFKNGAQMATVKRATGANAAAHGDKGQVIVANAPVSFTSQAIITTSGDFVFFAGIRSDPFFFDLMGFLNNFMFTGTDFFLNLNVFGIVLEVPNTALGNNPQIGIWMRCLSPAGDGDGDSKDFVQIDRMGHPALNTVFNHGVDKNTFNQIDPTGDRHLFGAKFEAVLMSFGYTMNQARKIMHILLPDILAYNHTNSGGYLNGRQLTDDVIDISLTLVTNGKITTDMVGPHTDYLSVFPFLGNPH
ncbi:MAG TPA: DUF4331 family protein [Ktedonobacteraceae bacterium]|nr:DUF4331 family protein [Ktedonobacteraceae bacterium]